MDCCTCFWYFARVWLCPKESNFSLSHFLQLWQMKPFFKCTNIITSLILLEIWCDKKKWKSSYLCVECRLWELIGIIFYTVKAGNRYLKFKRMLFTWCGHIWWNSCFRKKSNDFKDTNKISTPVAFFLVFFVIVEKNLYISRSGLPLT